MEKERSLGGVRDMDAKKFLNSVADREQRPPFGKKK